MTLFYQTSTFIYPRKPGEELSLSGGLSAPLALAALYVYDVVCAMLYSKAGMWKMTSSPHRCIRCTRCKVL